MASRDLVVHLIGDDASLQRAYTRSTAATQKFDRQMGQSTRGVAAGSGAFLSMGRSIAFASGTFLGAAGLTSLLKTSSQAASNLAEQQNKVNVIFGQSGRSVDQWAKTTARSMGIANDQALEAAGTFGNLFRTVNLAPQRNAELSRSLVQLAADMASFNNADPSEVLVALRSGLIGEAEPLRRFGVLLSETRVQQEAMRETGKRNVRALTDQEKVLARYNLIIKDTALAQGDFARTSGSLANQQRILAARSRDSAAAIGGELNPALQDAQTFFLAALDAANKFAAGVNRLPGGNFSGVDLFRGIGRGLGRAGGFLFGGGTSFGAAAVAPGTEGIRLRGLAGEAALGGGARGLAGRGPRWRAAMGFQASVLQAQLAQAELTAGTRDERTVLVRMQSLLRRRIAATRDLKLRTQLYQDLGSVQNQIESIDDKIAADKQDAADKEKAAKEKEREAERKRLEAHRDHIRKMRAAWQATLQKIREATAAVQGEFGALPFQPTTAGVLGAPVQGAKGFVGAYVTQTKAFVNFYNDLNRLRKMGAPPGLVEQLRGLGPEAAGLVHSLVTHPGQFNKLVRAYGQRQEAAMQIAKADIHAKTVHVHLGGYRASATAATSRRGPQAGVPSTIGVGIGGANQ